MTTNSREVYNCQEFIELHENYNIGKLDKETVHFCMRQSFPKRAEKIIAWLNRPLNPEAKDIHTVAKFDL
jgi:hypothetical protein